MDTNFKVGDAMTKRPITVSKSTTLIDCAKIMKDKCVGSLLILDNKRLVGIITEQDFVRSIIAVERDYKEVVVDDIMCKNLRTIEPSADLLEAIKVMSEIDIRHMPVVDNGELIGLLTAKDVLKIEPALIDILAQDMEIREEEYKPVFGESPIKRWFDENTKN